MKEDALELPLARQGVGRFTQWIVAAATCLAVLALAVAGVADTVLRQIMERPVVITVALPATSEPARLAAVRALLERTEGVVAVEPVAREELARLVEPWLGDGGREVEAAIPKLIDVTFARGYAPDLEELSAVLRRLQPDAVIEEERTGDPRRLEAARNLRALAAAASVVFAALGVAAVAAVTRINLQRCAETVDLLRQMGAPDRYLERQFEDHALRSALRGGLLGFLFGALVLLVLLEVSDRFGLGLFPGAGLRPVVWVLLASVPVVVLVLTGGAVRFVVGRELARPA